MDKCPPNCPTDVELYINNNQDIININNIYNKKNKKDIKDNIEIIEAVEIKGGYRGEEEQQQQQQIPDEKNLSEIEDENIPENDNFEEKLQQDFICCIGSTNLQAISECISYLDDFPYEVIKKALVKTAEANGNWKYAKAILISWKSKGIHTLAGVEEEENNFKRFNRNTKKSIPVIEALSVEESFDWNGIYENGG